MNIIVTGGSGKLGRAAIRELQAHGHWVLNLDSAPPKDAQGPFTRVDLTDFGEVMGALSGIDQQYRRGTIDAVVHLAAIPGPTQRPDHVTFAENIVSTYNIFEACVRLGIGNVVWASSETLLGYPFDGPPAHVPITEDVRESRVSYAHSKLLGEVLAEQYAREHPAMKLICLRFSNILDPDAGDYDGLEGWQDDAQLRRWNLWTYIDVRDAAQAVRLGVESRITGMEAFIIANEDSVMHRPSRDLLAEVFPGVPYTQDVPGTQSFYDISKAKSVLGFTPTHSWRRH